MKPFKRSAISSNERHGHRAGQNLIRVKPLERGAGALQARFNELTHRQSELEFHLDAGLIGGLAAQIGSTVYDGSIRGSLDRLRGKITSAVSSGRFRL